MGPGLLLNWFDLADESAADFNAWHSREHVIERLSIPGFVQGRRFVSLDAIPSPGHRYLVAYDTVDLSTLESPAYAARLDFPTPLTQKFVPSVRAMTRTAYEIVWSAGRGSGGFLRTIHLPSLGDLLGADGRELHENVSSVYGCDAVVKVGLGRPNGSITHFKDATREGRATDSRSRVD